MTDIFVKIEKNGQQCRLPKTIQDATVIYLLGYSFFDTSYNIRNFSLTQGANSLILPDGNYNFSELVFVLENANIDIVANERAGTIVFNDETEAQNDDTAKLFNSSDLTFPSGYNSGIVGLSLGRVFHFDIEELRSTALSSEGSVSYSILAKHEDAFGLVSKQDIINPQSAQCVGNMISTITPHIVSGDGQKLIINPNYPAYLHLYACYGKSQKLSSGIASI